MPESADPVDESIALLSLGSLTFHAAPGWSFFPLAERLVGRPESGIGAMQVIRVPSGDVPWPASHELCMAAAIAAAGFDLVGPGMDRARDTEENCLAGGESFRGERDFVRVWYRHCPDGMVAAWFAVKVDRAQDNSVRQIIRQCDRMIASARVAPPVA